ncbi:low specificity L-threonine aldolase [Pseudoflavonifractor sp. MSJ-37]|uniref:threonine aldolase family protein n=1 Tax=Pseudoflavonifractor sp. MSJ-37 TaxID=2841531 RepID=UPI001C11CA45|nr:aminotransferase class I/II-fold pyridoxal phosphate-dependent enzyme [Pseudoflavonifractor sp. MSJ-37]MBU5435301.1 aminotransferase class I/II-fold pyridoxal phosphate-dependent enzyme [Pseudoflavonifractor sp. MSJ-37]
MQYFESDYTEGAHPAVLQRLIDTNLEHLSGYGADPYCSAAREKILAACGCPGGDVSFLVGGTQTNAVVIGSLLRRYEGVVSADTGHVNVHEAGAIEYTGHKVLTVPSHMGKLDAGELEAYLKGFFGDGNRDHMVFPGMVYLSHPTEYGTLWSKAELEAVSAVCRRYELPLFVDGARLGYALASPENELSLPDLARLTDVFYIGGTKVGALCGEAVVFPKGAPAHLLTMVKQQGALLAKGRLLGIQFDALFTDGLYERIAGNAIRTARALETILREKGIPLLFHSPTNQIFAVLEDARLAALQHRVKVGFWEKKDEDHTVVRFATSWATDMEDVEALREIL